MTDIEQLGTGELKTFVRSHEGGEIQQLRSYCSRSAMQLRFTEKGDSQSCSHIGEQMKTGTPTGGSARGIN